MNTSTLQRVGRKAFKGIAGGTAILILTIAASRIGWAQANHAKRVNVNPLWTAPYSLNGENQYIGIFEFERFPYKNHPEFKNPTAKIAYVVPNTGPLGSHPTQVTGIILAKGGKPGAQGIARKASAELYITDFTIQRYLDEAGNGNWDISNHSYGPLRGWLFNAGHWQWMGSLETLATNTANSEDHMFGYYDTWAHKLDSLLNAEPSQIPVIAAGNQRGQGPDVPGTYLAATPTKNFFVDSDVPHPKNGSTGYDVLASQAVSKNAIVVGAVDMAGHIWERSCTGPTDDGRIKPDVVALGVDVTVCASNSSISGYDSTTDGTSLAAPAVSGSLLLLKQYWEKLFPSQVFISPIARALLIHTTTDLGPKGPDYQYGWGCVNATKAADYIKLSSTDNGFSIRRQTLQQGKKYEFYVKGKLNIDMRLTLAWADPAGTPRPFVGGSAPLNNTTPMLVNDLDIRIYPVLSTGVESESISMPYILERANPSKLATRGDNSVDNVEQIFFRSTNPYLPIYNFQHVYKVVISHKGTLTGGKQDFALIVGGATEYLVAPAGVQVSSSGTEKKGASPLAGNSAFVSWSAVPGAAMYDMQYRIVGTPSWTTVSNIVGTEKLISNLQAASYQVRVRSRHGNVISAWTSVVQFFGGDPVPPKSAWTSNIVSTSAKINWSSVSGVTQYNVKWARIAGDNTVLGSWKSSIVSGTSMTASLLVPDGRYIAYVRSKYSNNLYSDWSPAATFYTRIDCDSYEQSNTPTDARTLRVGDYGHGLLCKGDKEDWFRIYNPSGYKNLQVTLYQHSQPYRVSVYRSAKGSGQVSVLPGSPPAGIGTKVFTLNNADFTNNDYYVQVWIADPNVNYSNTENYTVIARTQFTPYPAIVMERESNAKVVGEQSAEGKGMLLLYPNPARHSTTVQFYAGTSGTNAMIYLYDIAGRELYSGNTTTLVGINSFVLSLGGLRSGMYVVVVESGEGRFVQRLTVAQ